MRSTISFVLDGRVVDVDFVRSGLSPTTTVLNYLRGLPQHTGTKEGCAEGDCGACTVVVGELLKNEISYRAVNSCLLFLPMLHGKHLVTVENLKSPHGDLHPVQQAMVDLYGSQCGFCTPGIVMSLYALRMKRPAASEIEIRRALAGNLCRCTGYKPILEAAARTCGSGIDQASTAHIAALLKQIPAESLLITTDRQTYVRPVTIGEALELRRLHPDAILANGATDIALRVTKGHELLPFIIDISGVDALRGWSSAGNDVFVGAGTTFEEFSECCANRFPALSAMLDVFGSRQIRNLATIGGNIGTASPVGDLMPALIAHKAEIVLRSTHGERRVPAAQFVTGYRRTAVANDELITGLVLPPVPQGTIIKSYKVSRRRDVDIAAVNAGFRLEIGNTGTIMDLILAYGGMADRVKRAGNTETFLLGKKWDRRTVDEAMHVIDTDFTPISDVRGSAAMRKIATRNLLLKFWAESSGNGGAA